MESRGPAFVDTTRFMALTLGMDARRSPMYGQMSCDHRIFQEELWLCSELAF